MTLVLNPAAIQAALNSPSGPVARDISLRAQRVRDQAVTNASGRPGPRVRTGRLRSSIHWRLVEAAPIYAVVGTNVFYARILEITGVRNGKKYPFLLPAAQAAHGTHVSR